MGKAINVSMRRSSPRCICLSSLEAGVFAASAEKNTGGGRSCYRLRGAHDVEVQDDALFVGVVPRTMIEGVVENDRFTGLIPELFFVLHGEACAAAGRNFQGDVRDQRPRIFVAVRRELAA